jgi:preprotein translocase subunit SecF
MASFTKFGNDLYTGSRSIQFVERRKVWYLISLVIIVVCAAGTLLRGGFTLGIEFTGGTQFQVSAVAEAETQPAIDVIESVDPEAVPIVTVVGDDSVRVQAGELEAASANEVAAQLAEAYDVPVEQVAATEIGPSWGQSVSLQALRALVVFLAIVAVAMALYFRTWKMSAAALIALIHDLVITAGVYGLVGFEVTPASVIGLLTILGFSLYDTVVVFDKVRENTAEETARTFEQSVNLAVNQTVVRSINTSVVATLPVAAILFIGALLLGAGTLRDIALALFVGTIVSTYSSVFIAAPTYAVMRRNEPEERKQGRSKEPATRGVTSGAVR